MLVGNAQHHLPCSPFNTMANMCKHLVSGRATPFMLPGPEGYGQQVLYQTPDPFEYLAKEHSLQPMDTAGQHVLSSCSGTSVTDSEDMMDTPHMTPQRYPSLSSSPEPESAYQDGHETTRSRQHPSLNTTPRRSTFSSTHRSALLLS